MSESQKRTLIVVLAVIAVGVAGYSAYNSMTPEKEQVVGTLDMGPQGGREAERGKGDVASGMPADIANPTGEGKQ
jgi:hypothetical protein